MIAVIIALVFGLRVERIYIKKKQNRKTFENPSTYCAH